MTEKRSFHLLPTATALVYFFLYLPIVTLVVLSFNNSRFSTIWRGFTWNWYVQAWNDAELVGSLRNSLVIALLTALFSTAIGTAAAIALARQRFRLKRLAEALVFLPVVVPEIVIGFATAVFFGLCGIAFGVSTVVAAHVAFSISYVVFIVRARVSGLNRSIEEAAMDLGATPWQTFRTVTLPMIMPAVLSAGLLVFTLSLDDYVITSFVAGPGAMTLPLKIYSMVKTGVTPEINAISSVLLVVTLLLVLVSERLSSGRLTKKTGLAAAAGVGLLVFFSLGGAGNTGKGGELNVFIWSNYLPDSVIADFERLYDVKLNVELYDSNEALLARLQSGSAKYDIVVPSDYMVTVLRAHSLIQKIDRDAISNFSNLDPQFTSLAYDSSNEYSVPYMWGTSGIAFRRDKIGVPVESWEVVFDPSYRDRVSMLDDVRETFGAALKYRGRSLNSTDPNEIREASQLLEQQKPLVKAYDSGGFDQLLLSGDVWIAQSYSGQIAKAMAEDNRIGYVIPKEGCTFFVDNLCIPTNASNREMALQFMNYVLDAAIAARIANETGYSTANHAAKALIKPELLANEAAYPPSEALGRCELIRDLGDLVELYDRYWTEIKSR